METGAYLVSDMLVTVKSREAQRAMLAEMRADQQAAALHFLAAAHLELVLAGDYQAAGDGERALRSQMSAASCFWRGGQVEKGREVFDAIAREHPAVAPQVSNIIAELTRDYPPGPR